MVEILDFQILAEVQEADVSRQSMSDEGIAQSIKIKRTTSNKFTQLFNNGVDAVMEKLGHDADKD